MDFLLYVTLLVFPVAAFSQDKKLPLPSPEEQRKAEEDIKSIFKEDLKKKDRASKADLSKKLMEQAKDPSNTQTSRYVLLLEAKIVAVEGFDFKTAFEAMDRLYDLYELPFPTLTGATFTVPLNAHKVEILNLCRKKANSQSDLNEIAEIYLSIAEDCQKKMEYEDAASSADLASKTTKDREIATRARGISQEISKQKEELAKVKKAEETLASNPKDPEANEIVGLYECFAKEDFGNGWAKILKSNDNELMSIAGKELDKPLKAAAQAELGEAWGKLAEKEKNPIQKKRYQDRCEYWCDLALSKATGLDRVKLQNKIKELKVTVEADSKGLIAHWKLNEESGAVAADYSGKGHDATLKGGAKWHSDASGKSLKFDGSTGYLEVKGTDVFSLSNPQTVSWKYFIASAPPATETMGQVIWAMSNVDARNTTMVSVFPEALSVGKWSSRTGLLYSALPSPKQWHACVYVSDGKESKLYVDGTLRTTSKTAPDSAKVTRFELGRWGGGAAPVGSYFNGLLRDVRVYDRVLTDAEIALLSRSR